MIKDYMVEWEIVSITGFYDGRIEISGYDVEDVKNRAIRKVANNMCTHRALVSILNVKEV